MENYRHILLALDFSEHHPKVAERALDLAHKHEAKLSLIHVVENLPIGDTSYGPIVPFDLDLTEQMVESARQRLNQLAVSLQLPKENVYVEIGSPKAEIVRVAEENGVDLIVVGSHGRHGIALLLGSTAGSVIHHAKCDVLAVRLRADE
ncbi:universal stress protein [Methylococcus sp. EFPC2]|uniref:universal stress protein n=1 Tax=Methylococcus sp. EFPC2 TaxID=2812648 RepID=UPI00196835A9|nr:universal stress protein [Methylococcus sp. EFPC2]QSA98598.1 universal stress protein [Methylococcus sp. EFPC2]